MTYGEIYDKAIRQLNLSNVDDYRPAYQIYEDHIKGFIPNAIIIWLKSGETIIYIDKEESKEFIHQRVHNETCKKSSKYYDDYIHADKQLIDHFIKKYGYFDNMYRDYITTLASSVARGQVDMDSAIKCLDHRCWFNETIRRS